MNKDDIITAYSKLDHQLLDNMIWRFEKNSTKTIYYLSGYTIHMFLGDLQ